MTHTSDAFTQRDPAGDGVNHYAYAANNPMMFIDPTGMYIVLPGGTEIRSVPEQVDGRYVKPDLTGNDSVVWDSIFTGGINGTGIAGSNAAGGIVTDIIESSTPVHIRITENLTPGAVADATLDPNNGSIRVRINEGAMPPQPQYEGQRAPLTMALVHEFSHVHDFMKIPQDFIYGQPYHFSYVTEMKAFDLEARYAIEMDRADGNYNPAGWYSGHTGFNAHQLTNYGSVAYYGRLNRLALKAMLGTWR